MLLLLLLAMQLVVEGVNPALQHVDVGGVKVRQLQLLRGGRAV